MKNWQRGIFAVLMLVWGMPVWGADFFGHAQSINGSLVIPSGKPLQNVYAAASTVTLKVPTRVKGNFYAAGRAITVDTSVGNNAHLAGREVGVGGTVGQDLIAVAETLGVLSTAKVGGDLIVAGLHVDIEGPIHGRAWIAGGQVTLNGSIGGGAVVRYDQGLSLGSGFRSNGKLTCYGPQPPQVEAFLTASDIDYHHQDRLLTGVFRLSRWASVFGWAALIRLAAWLLAAWLLVKLFPRHLAGILGTIQANPRRDFGAGLLAFILCLAGIPVLFMTLVGSYVSLVAASVFLTGMLLARILAVFYLGFLFRRFLEKKRTTSFPFRWVAGAILVLHLLGLIPLVGCLFAVFLTLTAFGALVRLGAQGLSLKKST
jgi:hypothetical protein